MKTNFSPYTYVRSNRFFTAVKQFLNFQKSTLSFYSTDLTKAVRSKLTCYLYEAAKHGQQHANLHAIALNMADHQDAVDSDEEEDEKANLIKEENREKVDREQRRQTRSDQRSIFDFVQENSADLENISSGLLQETRHRINSSFETITHTREQLNDALLFREESLIIRNMAAKMDDVSR